jgi:signal transduction histidine kinase
LQSDILRTITRAHDASRGGAWSAQEGDKQMTDVRSNASLIEEAWRVTHVDWRASGALGRLAAERARRSGDAMNEAFGLFHAAYCELRTAPAERAAMAVDKAIERCAELGVQRGTWLCNDLRGLQAHFRGEPAEALAIGEANDRIPAGDRSADERFITLALLHYATRAAGQIADSLRYGYRLLSLAEAMDSDEHRAHALHNLGALQADTFNVEDAVVLQERALALARKLGATELPAPFTGDLLYTYAALNQHDKAYRTLSEWLAQPGGVTAADRHHQCAAIALSYLGAGRLEEAEQALALGPFPHPTDAHLECSWTWVRGGVLCARGRHAEARNLCTGYLARANERKDDDYPFEAYRLQDVIRIASEALGDAEGAEQAVQRQLEVCAPLVGNSARSQYLSLQFRQSETGNVPRDNAADKRRLAAIDQGVADYSAALARQGRTAPPTPSVPADPLVRQRRFVAHVSHEMRSPIGGVLGMTSLLLLSNLDERQRRFVSLAKTSAETLLQLVNDILDLAKIESGRFQLDLQPFSIATLAGEVAETFQVLAQQKGVALTLTVDPALPRTLTGDSLRLRQILTNLVGNAVKFTSTGSVTLGVFARRALRSDEPADSCATRIEVRDTGEGISEEGCRNLFTEFMQEDASTARRFGGTGLGLAVTRQLVHLMNGEIGVESVLGKGSLFWVELELPVPHFAESTL